MLEAIARRRFLKFLAASPLLGCTAAGRLLAEESLDTIRLPDYLINSAAEALDVFDFHTVAKHRLPPAHYGYLATGTDGNETLSANRRAFEDVYIRPMRMVDTSDISLETTLLDERLKSPIVLAPVGSQRAFHPDAELASARAARAQEHLQILSNVTSNPIENVIAARGEPVWFQLYPTNQWSTAQMMLERAERAGARVVVLTVDLNSGSNRVLLGQYVRTDDRDCSSCHGSNGADAVCIGRAYIWGLAAFGQPGVEKVLEMLKAELSMVMGQMGARTIDEIGSQHIGTRR
jgi:4-hydroxymandelate oxidase